MKYSCVIPLYNENPLVLGVLQAITQVPEIDEIICVDDGSTDGSKEAIKKNFPQVKLIIHNKNQGKANAVLDGVNESKSDILLLLDADLRNLQKEEISNAFKVFNREKLDCLLLCTPPLNFGDRVAHIFFRVAFCMSGCRIVYKSDLLETVAMRSCDGYQLEVAQNWYLMRHHKRVVYLDVSALNTMKKDKLGKRQGTLKEIKMWRQINGYAGFWSLIYMSLVFARKRVY
jgi:glycosyltransferase involved in cell wall biosynthesis